MRSLGSQSQLFVAWKWTESLVMGFIVCKCKYPEIHRSIMIFLVKTSIVGIPAFFRHDRFQRLQYRSIQSERSLRVWAPLFWLTVIRSRELRRRNLKYLQSCELFWNLSGPTKTCVFYVRVRTRPAWRLVVPTNQGRMEIPGFPPG